MKGTISKLGALILSVCLVVSLGLFSIPVSADAYTGVNGGEAQGGVEFVSDWAQKATSKTTVPLDGLSVTFTEAQLDTNYSMLGFGLTKSADSVDLGGTGEGVLFKLMYSGSDAADVMPMNIKDWHDTNAPANTNWVHNFYLGAGIWPSYTFRIQKNGTNYEFWVNEKLVTSIPTATVEALTGTNPYITFYMWNNVGGKCAITDVAGSMPKAEEYTLSGATMTNRKVKIVSDWLQRVKYNEKVKLDGLSVTIRDLSVESAWGMVGFGLAKDEAGVEMDGSTGNGVLFKLAYTGTDTVLGQNMADVMPMNITDWNNTAAPAGTSWVHEKYLGDDLRDTYTFTVTKNGNNYDFKINDQLVASVPVADVQALTNADGSAWLSLYSWNGKNTYVVESIGNTKTAATTTATQAPTKTTTTKKDTLSTTTTVTDPTDTTTTAADTTTTTASNAAVTTTTTADGGTDTDVPPADNNGWILPVTIVAVLMIAFCGVGVFIVIKRRNAQS